MNRRSVCLRVARRDHNSLNRLRRRERPHRDDQRPPKRSRRYARQIRPIHRHVAACLEMAHGKTRALHRGFKAQRAPEQKGDEIVSPPADDIRWLLDEHTPLIHTVTRHVNPHISSGGNMAWLPGPGFRHVQEGTGLGIAVTETQEIKRQNFRYDHQVRLKIVRRETARRTHQQARSCLGSNVHSANSVGAHVASLRTAACRSRSARAIPASGTQANKSNPLRKSPLPLLRRPIA